MADKDGVVTLEDLPMTFQVKYLGKHDTRGLSGIKHTRRPVDTMVAAAKALPQGQILPIVRLQVSTDGVQLETVSAQSAREEDDYEHMSIFINIKSIMCCIKDLVYPRVFSMIVVKDKADMKGVNPFECHAFVCDSRNSAKKIQCALALAFRIRSRRAKELRAATGATAQILQAELDPHPLIIRS